MPEPYRNSVVCLGCFDALASQKGIRYAHAMDGEISFGGDAGTLLMVLQSRIEADGCR